MADVRQAAIVAAKWWTEKIATPNADSFCNGDRKSDESFMMMIMGHMNAMQNAATPEQLEEFCNILAERLEKELTNSEKVTLECDYYPDRILEEIADELNIHTCLFPFKRSMLITSDSVKVKDGCDRDWKQLYSEKSE